MVLIKQNTHVAVRSPHAIPTILRLLKTSPRNAHIIMSELISNKNRRAKKKSSVEQVLTSPKINLHYLMKFKHIFDRMAADVFSRPFPSGQNIQSTVLLSRDENDLLLTSLWFMNAILKIYQRQPSPELASMFHDVRKTQRKIVNINRQRPAKRRLLLFNNIA